MMRIRVIAEVRVHDYERAVEVLSRAADHIDAHLDGTATWDIYTDEANERMVWYEEFIDEQALLEYERAMTQAGIREDVSAFVDLERVTVLGSLSDIHLSAIFNDIGAERMAHSLGRTPS